MDKNFDTDEYGLSLGDPLLDDRWMDRCVWKRDECQTHHSFGDGGGRCIYMGGNAPTNRPRYDLDPEAHNRLAERRDRLGIDPTDPTTYPNYPAMVTA